MPRSKADRSQRGMVLGVLVILVVQFLLGMAVNLFVKVSDNHPGFHPPEYFRGVAESVTWAILHGPVLLALHAALGLLLVAAALGLTARSARSGSRRTVVISAFGLIGVLAAGFNGGSFLNYHEDFSSMLMATGFAVAVTAYGIGLYSVGPAGPEGATE